jgi:hypothetical protein
VIFDSAHLVAGLFLSPTGQHHWPGLLTPLASSTDSRHWSAPLAGIIGQGPLVTCSKHIDDDGDDDDLADDDCDDDDDDDDDDGDGWPAPLASTMITTGQQHWPPPPVSTTGLHHWPGPLATSSKDVDVDVDDDDDDDAEYDYYDDEDDDDNYDNDDDGGGNDDIILMHHPTSPTG